MTIMVGTYATVTIEQDGAYTLYVVREIDHNVSETFEDRDKALRYFEHTERYEAAQARKGRR